MNDDYVLKYSTVYFNISLYNQHRMVSHDFIISIIVKLHIINASKNWKECL